MTTSIENDLQKEIKKLAIDLERPLNESYRRSLPRSAQKIQKEGQ